MSISMCLKIPGVTGGSTDVGFVGALAVLAFSWGASNPTVVAGGGGGVKPAIQDLSFTSYVDTATAPLIQKILGGLTSTSAVLTVVTPTTGGGTTNDVYTLTTLLVSSVSLGGPGGEEPAHRQLLAQLRPAQLPHLGEAGHLEPHDQHALIQRIVPVCPNENRPGCGQTRSPWGPASTGIWWVTAPDLVSKT